MNTKKRPLKLYVWEDVLTDYTSGVMFALAHSAKEARKLIRAGDEKSDAVRQGLRKRPKIVARPEGFKLWGGG